MSEAVLRRAVLLMGPTGAGKSALAIELSQRLPLEIVSVDSAMVYRGMDIGTAKPDLEIRHTVPHHLIDIRDPCERYSAGEFVADAAHLMQDIWRRGRQPLFVGGTMLYFRALSAGIADLPEADLAVRAEIDAEAAALGWPHLHAMLGGIDPEAASRVHPHDAQRIQRAHEVHRLTGVPISQLQRGARSVLTDVKVNEFAVAPADRGILHERIDARFRTMLAAGFVDEVRGLRERNAVDAEHPSMRAVGYRQVWRHLTGECALDEAVTQAIAATRQLAKRQFTWLRARNSANWVDSARSDPTSFVINLLSDVGFRE